jgi:hypothetical protein
VNQSPSNAALRLGFLSIQQEINGSYLGGYLVTNAWGRPLEFRLSSAVQPNRIQQILYSRTLLPYLCADLIGKTLVEKTTTRAQLIVTDQPAALDLRLHVDIPVGCISSEDGSGLSCHPSYKRDEDSFRDLLAGPEQVDLAEPFARVREAMAEARKMGVTNRG